MTESTTFDTIARYYDLLYGEREDDLDLWLDLTASIDGPILEIGCGTGRVMVPLLQHERRVTGIDISAVALEMAQIRLEAGGFSGQASLHLADMGCFDLPNKNFAMALVPINTFMHCQTLADQQATLKAINDHLQPGGRLVIDLFHPTPQMLLASDGELILERTLVDDLTEHTVQWFVARRLQLDRQVQDVTFMLDEITDNGTISRVILSFSLRYVHRYEMLLLLEQAGFQITETLGDYDGSPFFDESPRMIFIAQKR
jgi:ubiquinone/menaquinone biosynthesis C-methylase UbiE